MPAIEELTKGDVVATRTIDITRADLIRYAGASGDYNPIHWSEATAKAAELPGVIAHGMLTMGLVVDLVSEWTNDPRSEEHTSELQSRGHLVCRLLLENTKT